ncbi:MAG: hemerythrin family protein [Deltaproteobacteria bacterium]|nr:hemerythrin family protein [Deltaproteobacteria bacterium]
MALFEWNDSYSVKVGLFDGHHKKLVGMINELHQAMVSRQANAVIEKILDSLVDYTKYHFTEEERLMKQHGYPGYEQQKKEHADLVSQVADIQDRYKKGSLSVSLETMSFLKNWLSSHILGTDKKYSRFFADRGVV